MYPVGSRIVFIDGKPARHLYRIFNIRDEDGGDDYASMEQVIERRFKRLKTVKRDKVATSRDASHIEAWARPDLVVIDGGKGQLGSAIKALEKVNINTQLDELVRNANDEPIYVCALAKNEELVFIPGKDGPINNAEDNSSPAILLLRALRDESHRFALNAHRRRRLLSKSV